MLMVIMSGEKEKIRLSVIKNWNRDFLTLFLQRVHRLIYPLQTIKKIKL
jgi:hypothetical protein